MFRPFIISLILSLNLLSQDIPDELKMKVDEKDNSLVEVSDKSDSPEEVLKIDISNQFSSKSKLDNKVLQVPETETSSIPTFYIYASIIIGSVLILLLGYRAATGFRYFRAKHVEKTKDS